MASKTSAARICEKLNIKSTGDQLPPLLSALLDESVVDVLDAVQWDCGFQSDEEYLKTAETVFVVQQQFNTLKRNFQSDVIRTPTQTWDHVAVKLTELQNQFSVVKSVINDLVDNKLQLSQVKPRILRVCDRLGLTTKESTAFLLVLLHHAGTALPHVDTNNYGYVSVLARLANMSSKEWLHFISEGRTHFKQGLMEMDLLYRDTLSSAVLKMQTEVIAVLVGAELSAAEALKIDKTVLAEVLAEEEDAEKDSKATEAKKDTKKEKKDETETDETTATGGDEQTSKKDKDDDSLSAATDVTDYLEDMDFDLYKYIEGADGERPPGQQGDDGFLSAYTTDVAYLDDLFQYIAILIKIRNAESDTKEDENNTKAFKGERSCEAVMRELRGKERVFKTKIEKRLTATKLAGDWLPRVERLVKQRNLTHFEKMVLLLLAGSIISHDVVVATYSGYGARRSFGRDSTVGFVLWVLCDTLETRVQNRATFYKSSTLVKDAMIKVADRTANICDLMDCTVDIDRRMLDYIVGLDTEFNELVDGSNLYHPTVKLENVILPPEQKALVMSTVANYENFCLCKKRIGLDEMLSYGAGIVMLFYGPSGTGKTMLANAVANALNKKLLLVNWSTLNASLEKCGDLLKYIFREAKLHNALIFFDECENLFESRQRNQSSTVTALLVEIEKFDGLIILATNRAFDLDEAMNRRITIAVEFKHPDHELRRQIWVTHIPPLIQTEKDIDFDSLAMSYELTGGLIKNAALSGISIAVAREGVNPVLTMQDLQKGAQTQLRGSFQRDNLDRKLQPQSGLDEVVLPDNTRSQIQEVVKMDKGRKVLFTQSKWAEMDAERQGLLVLLYGPKGCGKSSIASAIGYECGYGLKVVNVSELLSKYPAETYKNVEKIFRDAKRSHSLLVFEDAERLFGYTGQNSISVRDAIASLKYSLRHCTSIVVMIGQFEDSSASKCDELFDFNFLIHVPFPPASCRQILWERCISRFALRNAHVEANGTPSPSKISEDGSEKPILITQDVPFSTPPENQEALERLANIQLSAADINHACLSASSQAALDGTHTLTYSVLEEAAQLVANSKQANNAAAGMYN